MATLPITGLVASVLMILAVAMYIILGNPIWILGAIPIGVVGGAIIGILTGIAMTFVYRHSYSPSSKHTGVRQTRAIQVATSAEKAFDICKEAVGQIPFAHVDTKRTTTDKLVARTDVSLTRCGSKITCIIHSKSAAKQLVTIESRPIRRTTLIDFGSNEAIVSEVLSHFELRGLAV